MKKAAVATVVLAAVALGGYAYGVHESRTVYNQALAKAMQAVKNRGQLRVDRSIDKSSLLGQTETVTLHFVDPRVDKSMGPLVIHQTVSFAGFGPSGVYSIDTSSYRIGKLLKQGDSQGFVNKGTWHYNLFTHKSSGQFHLEQSSVALGGGNLVIEPLKVTFTGERLDGPCHFVFHWKGGNYRDKGGVSFALHGVSGKGTESTITGQTYAPDQHMAVASFEVNAPHAFGLKLANLRMDSKMSLKDGFYDMDERLAADSLAVGPAGAQNRFANPSLHYSVNHLSSAGMKALSRAGQYQGADAEKHVMAALEMLTGGGVSFSLENLSVDLKNETTQANGKFELPAGAGSQAGVAGLLHSLKGKASLTLGRSLEMLNPRLHQFVEQVIQQGFGNRNAASQAVFHLKVHDGQAVINGRVIPLG